MKAPIANKQAKEITTHNHTRIDNYYWLNEKENPETIAYLEAENAYTEAMMQDTKVLQEQLFEEMKGRIQEDDFSVPYLLGNYWYYSRYYTGMEYPLFCRIAEKPSNFGDSKTFQNEHIFLNVNELAKEYSYFSVNSLAISPKENLLAYAEDTVSRRIYTIRLKNLVSNQNLTDTIIETSGTVLWADEQTIIYVKKDVESLRDYQVFRHKIGTEQAEDELLFEETDDTFYVDLSLAKSKKYIFVHSISTLTDEVQFLDLTNPNGKLQIIEPRTRNLKYSVEHWGNDFIIRNNENAENFKIAKTPITKPQKENWTEIIAHDANVFIENFDVFEEFLVIEKRENGLIKFQIYSWKDFGKPYEVEFDENTYLAYLDINNELHSTELRFVYTSLTTPSSVFMYNMQNKQKTLLKQQTVLGNFDKNNYQSDRIWATATDGTKIPISLVYHKNTVLDGTAPLLQYGYGSYGITIDATFSSARLSLLDRGFVYAIAHIRGGQELGRQWYENGKLLQKMNTFTDFIAVSEHLISQKYTNKNRLFAYGGSAGGLLMGAIINLRADLYMGIIAAVPFVDCVTTMLDDTIPLTTFEYDEWGNPNEKTYYDYMLSYSPYDNVVAKDYPNILITTGLHDSQVQYFEPAKWTAKLRAYKTDNNLLLLHTDMSAGHGGASGRFKRLYDIALEYAFMLKLQ
jgi:oligopeptidase B